MTNEWFKGSNGNLFFDSGEFRYCIAKDSRGYEIARNGVAFEHAPSVAEAKLIVQRETE